MAITCEWTQPGDPTCCCEECCLYPFPDPFGTPLYPDTDLPDEVVISGTTLTRSGYSFSGGTMIIYDAGFFVWYYQDTDGNEAQSNCLIATYSSVSGPAPTVEDQFPSTLTATLIVDDSPLEVTMNRISLCTWSGTDSTYEEFTLQVTYDDTLYKWIGRMSLTQELGDYFKLNADFSDASNNTPTTPDGEFYNGPAYVFPGSKEWNGQFTLLP